MASAFGALWVVLAVPPYDRVVHFAYGLLLVLPLREWLMGHAGA
ncbi:MAG: hypothetical protein ACKO7G_13535 [Gammaproteobacteria bacterium]